MTYPNSNSLIKYLLFLIFIGVIACTSSDASDEKEDVGPPYVSAEISGDFWVADTITRSGLSVQENSQSFNFQANNDKFSMSISLSESENFEKGKLSTGSYNGTRIFIELTHLYGPYAIQAYFQGNRSVSENVITVISSDENTISGNFSGTFYKGELNYPPIVDDNSPDQIKIKNGEFRNMPLDLFSSSQK